MKERDQFVDFVAGNFVKGEGSDVFGKSRFFGENLSQKIEQDKNDIDEGDGGLVKVVVIVGDKFAQFVDEKTEAKAANDGTDGARDRGDVGDENEIGNQHKQTTPEDVSNMKMGTA